MCRFLLSKHADVDVYIYKHHPFVAGTVTLMAVFGVGDSPDYSAEERTKNQECCRLLLEAGADPMVETEEYIPPFFDVFDSNNVVSIQVPVTGERSSHSLFT